jgi:hypothetical protein
MLFVIGCSPNAIVYTSKQFNAVDFTRVKLVTTVILALSL